MRRSPCAFRSAGEVIHSRLEAHLADRFFCELAGVIPKWTFSNEFVSSWLSTPILRWPETFALSSRAIDSHRVLTAGNDHNRIDYFVLYAMRKEMQFQDTYRSPNEAL